MKNINKIKLIVLDVDGVLTDGKIVIDSNGVEYKSFNVKDGMGISIAKFYGIKFAIITGRKSNSVDIRSKELNIDYVYQGISNKEVILSDLLNRIGLDYENVCYIGDDINDLSVIRKVGYSFAPKDAINQVKKEVDKVTIQQGGNGSVREAIDIILYSQTNYESLIFEFLNSKNKVTQ
jgi:3-deoxy-D-manno-octulosonate 8-phosphate phosphatase (KDO 8-P phosphatase)